MRTLTLPLAALALLALPVHAADPTDTTTTEAHVDALYARAVDTELAVRSNPKGAAAARAAWAAYVDALEAAMPTTPGLHTEEDAYRRAYALALAGRAEAALPALDRIAAEQSPTCRPSGPTCAEDARRIAWQTRRDQVIATLGGDTTTPGFTLAPDTRYPLAIGTPRPESRVPRPDGAAPTRYAMPAAAAAFIRDTDALLAYPFTDPGIRARIATERTALQLQTGQLLFAYGHMAEARERLIPIVEASPGSEPARIAANLYLESIRREGDPAALSLAAQEVATRMGASSPAAAAYVDVAAASAFRAIEARDPSFGAARRPEASPTERVEVARAYVTFADAQPKSAAGVRGTAAEIARGRAASLLVEARATREAIEALERFLAEYPESPHALGLTWQLAVTASRGLDVPKAIAAYESFISLSRRPQMEAEARRLWEARVDPAHATVYAAALREVNLEHRAAAKAWERYASEYAPDRPDGTRELPSAEEALWRAGKSWQRVGDAEALAFAKRYVASAASQTDPGHVVLAWDLIARLETKRGNAAGVRDAAAVRTRAYETAKGGGAPLPRSVHHAGLASARKALEDLWTTTATDPWQESDEYNLDRLISGKGGRHGIIALVDVNAIITAAAPLIASPDYVSQQMGGYYAGLAWARHAALLRIERPSPLALARPYPAERMKSATGTPIDPGSEEYAYVAAVLRDGDVNDDGAPDFVGSEMAEAEAMKVLAATLRQAAVSMEPGAPHWTDWTSRSLELLDVELRSPDFRRDRAVALGLPTAPGPADATASGALAAARAALADASTDEALLAAARAAIDARAPMLALMALSGVDTRYTVAVRTRADVSALRGAARVQLEERLEAGHAFEQALALDPQQPVALRGQLTLALEDRDFRRALPLAERLHRLHPDDTGILLQLGAARLGETQRAYRDGATADAAAQAAITLETLEQARARAPNEPDAHRNLAILHTATALGSAMPTPAQEAALSALQLHETTARAASRTVDADELRAWREELERHGRRTQRRAERQLDKEARAMCATLAEKAAPRVTTCLAQAQTRAPKASGLVRATWTVLEGDTRDITLPLNTTGDVELGACVTREVDGWTFGETTCDMTWEWTLSPPSPGK